MIHCFVTQCVMTHSAIMHCALIYCAMMYYAMMYWGIKYSTIMHCAMKSFPSALHNNSLHLYKICHNELHHALYNAQHSYTKDALK